MSMMLILMMVMCKELCDLLCDCCMLLLILLFGLLLYLVLLLGMGKLVESWVCIQIEELLQILIIGVENVLNLVCFFVVQGFNVVLVLKDLVEVICIQDIDVVLCIGDDFGRDWVEGKLVLVEVIKDSMCCVVEVFSVCLEVVLVIYNGQVGVLCLMVCGIDVQVVCLLDVVCQDLVSVEVKCGMILLMLLLVLLMLILFIGGVYLVMDVIVGECEWQLLELLLVMLGLCSVIVSGKIVVVCVVGFVLLLLILVVFKVSVQIVFGNVGCQFNMNVGLMLQMLLVMLLMLLIGILLLIFLLVVVKSMKEVQSYMIWLMLLLMLFGYVLVVYLLKSEMWQYVVLFLLQNQMLLKVICYEIIILVVWVIYFGVSFGLVVVLWFVVVCCYYNECLVIFG